MYAKTAWLLALALIASPGLAPAPPPPAIVVNSTADTTANDGACTLREAIISANTNKHSSDSANGCIAGVTTLAVDKMVFDVPATDARGSGSTTKPLTAKA